MNYAMEIQIFGHKYIIATPELTNVGYISFLASNVYFIFKKGEGLGQNYNTILAALHVMKIKYGIERICKVFT